MRFLGVLYLLLTATPGQTFDTRFATNPAAPVEVLFKSGEIYIEKGRFDGPGGQDVYFADASAVLKVDFGRLRDASQDFNRYVEIGMPFLLQNRVVEQTPQTIFTWSEMNFSGQISRHYLEVETVGDGTRWQLHSKKTGWPHPEKTPLTRLEGSWFMQRVQNSSGEQGVYARYYISASFDSWVPRWILSDLVKKKLAKGVRQVMQALAQEARARP